MKKTEKRKIVNILSKEKNILFAYLYGSFLSSDTFKDVDLAVYLKKVSFAHVADLRMKIARVLNKPSNFVDITVLNGILESHDAFSLLYLERVLKEGEILARHNIKVWSDFIERYSNKSRESVAILGEASR